MAYQRYIEFPPSLTWHVIEVPAMVRIGCELARQKGLAVLTFTDSAKAGDARADIWVSAGAIHYIEHGRPDVLLREASFRPRCLLLNSCPCMTERTSSPRSVWLKTRSHRSTSTTARGLSSESSRWRMS